MSIDRRAFLLGIGAVAGCLSTPQVALASSGPRRIDLRTLLAIVGPRPGGTSWVESIAHILEFTPTRPPKVLFAEAALTECSIRRATTAETAAAGLSAGGAYHIAVRGGARALEAGTHRPLERFTNAATGRSHEVPVTRWTSNLLVTETEWVALDESPPVKRARGQVQVADSGGQWCVFHSGAAFGFDSFAPGAAVESTGWRVRPADLGADEIASEYNHVCYSPAGLRPWLGYDADSPVRLLENATGHKILDRSRVSAALAPLLA
jgi:hypothetical protein